jgi:hypothetical protein
MSMLLSNIDLDQNTESRNASVAEISFNDGNGKKKLQLSDDPDVQVKQLRSTVKQLSDSRTNLQQKLKQ